MNEPLDLNSGRKEEKNAGANSPASPNINTPISPSGGKKDGDDVSEVVAKVDLTKKPQSINEPINLLDDDEFFNQQTQKTEGDIKQQKEDERKKAEAKAKLSSSSNAPLSSSSSSSSKPPISSDKRLAQAEKWMKAIDIARVWGLKQWSGQVDNTGLAVPESDLKILSEALADVMEEYDFNPAPLLTLAVTTVAVFGNSFSNAHDARKKIRKFRREHPEKAKQAEESKFKTKPELDPASGKHSKRRGGQPKA